MHTEPSHGDIDQQEDPETDCCDKNHLMFELVFLGKDKKTIP
jgi:hypothetical protein